MRHAGADDARAESAPGAGSEGVTVPVPVSLPAGSLPAPSAPSARVELRDLVVAYGSTRVVHGVSLRVAAGSVLGIVGESGSGKTSVARAIAGELAPAAGEVLLDGQVLPGTARTLAQRRAVQVVYQDPYASLNPRMTVGQVLRELLTVHRVVPRAQVRARSTELVELVRLPPEVLDARPRQLSGGQRQRVALARALALEPQVLVADEPTSALDVSVQRTVLDVLVDLQQRLGLTVVLISHDLAVVHSLCDRVVVMRDGRVVEDAPAAEFFRSPQHPYSRALLDVAPRLRRDAVEQDLTHQDLPHHDLVRQDPLVQTPLSQASLSQALRTPAAADTPAPPETEDTP